MDVKTIMVMYDSLIRDMLEPYGCEWTKTPNFTRLARQAVTFENNYAGSLPCMPARRELHTGRYNFLHRGWGPMEPFDDSMPELLKQAGVYAHLVSDHWHYWEDGGATYHTRYNSWECGRGQEGDPWKAYLGTQPEPSLFRPGGGAQPAIPDAYAHNAMNRKYIGGCEDRMPQAVTFEYGLQFIEDNHGSDNWFLQIETFDPHEPFFSQETYKALYPHHYTGPQADWPPYGPVQESGETVAHVRYEYAALLAMCDTYLGKVLDAMDRYELWKDTLLIVNTDHGYLLGEHGWWSKSVMPIYNEIAHTPLFIHDPRCPAQGQRRKSLTQTIDLPATILEFFGLPLPEHMQGMPLCGVLKNDEPVREYGLFGYHGGYTCVTDGRFVYMRAPASAENQPLYEYTLMPMHMNGLFSPQQLCDIQLCEPFSFTKGCRTMKIAAKPGKGNAARFGTKLYNVEEDPRQESELEDAQAELRMENALEQLLRENCAPTEQYVRLGLAGDKGIAIPGS
ncbi:sulfatase [Ruminococcaceae bacterium OttesenSCG-928-D13]|nr:sulfatase [Ruminococcaceae bacterium OttesenSCG-928-D13]